jgi:beta-galactosidase
LWRTGNAGGLNSDQARHHQLAFLRGYVDCCIFPRTGYPVWDVTEYRRQLQMARAHGFNHVRLHGWTPPPPFWQAADEVGMLVQTELPHWSRFYRQSEVAPPAEVADFLWMELRRVIARLNAHPSWIMLSLGNELIGPDGHPELNRMVAAARALDPTRLYTDNTGHGELPSPGRDVDYFVQSCNWHPPLEINRAATPDSREDFAALPALSDKPVIGHEHGQFTMYVRPSEEAKYTGILRPTWLRSILPTLAAKGLDGRIDEFIRASGVHLIRALKENVERARRTPGLAGIQLLDIRDFPGQGHATTGILDVFWESKGLIEPATFTRFNGDRVLLMRSSGRTV